MKTSAPPSPSRWRSLGHCLPLLGLLLAACGPTDATPPQETRAVRQSTRALGSTLLVGAETPVSTSATESRAQTQTVVAAGPDMYFVVWVQHREEDPPDLRGMRIRASDGVPLDSAPLVLSTDFLDEWPSVVFDGTNFLVSWFDETRYFNTRGIRVRASDGALLDSSPLNLTSTDYFLQWPATVSFDGTNYLTTYRAIVYDPEEDSASLQILAHRIRPSDGALLDAHSLHVGVMGDGYSVVRAHAAGHAGTTLVAWAGDGVRAARVDSTGQVLDTVPLTLSTSGAGKVRVAARPGEFLVVWSEGTALKARRVRASDGALLEASALSVGASAELLLSEQWPHQPFDVTFDGQDYRVLWQSTQPERQLRTTRVATDGTLGTDAQEVLATFKASTTPDWVSLAAGGPGDFLVAYPQEDAGRNRIQFRRVRPNDCAHDVTPPTVTCPATLLKECVFSAQTTVPGAEFDDNCGLSSVNTQPRYYGHPGTFTSSVSATDLSGNSASCSTAWTVVDTRKPHLYLAGPSPLTLRYGEPYEEPGAYGDDECDGYYTSNRVRIHGSVNSWQPGSYGITYVLTDSAGNQSEAIRFVQVLAP